jgi:hypothetical protein
MSGAAGERCALVTASAFNLPPRTCGIAESMVSKKIAVWPPWCR